VVQLVGTWEAGQVVVRAVESGGRHWGEEAVVVCGRAGRQVPAGRSRCGRLGGEGAGERASGGVAARERPVVAG